MGCGASVDGDSDSHSSQDEDEEEWDRNRRRDQRKNENDLSKNHSQQRQRFRKHSNESDEDSAESNGDDDDDGGDNQNNRPRRPQDPRTYNHNNYGRDGRIAVVSDLVQNPTGAGAGDGVGDDEKKLFVDASFPPSESSLYHSRKVKDPKIVWMRPHELASEPHMFINGASRHDIIQGVLADCWFLSSCAAVAQRPDLMDQVIPPDQPLVGNEYNGRIIFQFWRFGRWVAIYIDDLLPTKKRKLVYSRSSDPKEFWVSLLEKAYAKVHGSYEALAGGQAMDALVDLTGGLAERYEMTTAPPHLYDYLLQASSSGAFVTCSRKGDWRMSYTTEANGLVTGHVYTISAVATVKLSTGTEAYLIRIRNPWGNDTEWNGQWNDSDETWRSVDSGVRHTMGINQKGDGEFWMSFQDFGREFEEVTICSLKPDLKGTGVRPDEVQDSYHVATEIRAITGRWDIGKTAGGSRNNLVKFATNPQFLLTVAQPEKRRNDAMQSCHIVIAEMQLRRRCVRHPGRKMLQIGFVLYKVLEPVRQTLEDIIHSEEVGNSGPYINYREVFGRFELLPGYYVVVPATFEPNSAGSFLIRIFADTQIAIREL